MCTFTATLHLCISHVNNYAYSGKLLLLLLFGYGFYFSNSTYVNERKFDVQ